MYGMYYGFKDDMHFNSYYSNRGSTSNIQLNLFIMLYKLKYFNLFVRIDIPLYQLSDEIFFISSFLLQRNMNKID